MNKNIKKVILLSGPRHGTTYIVEALKKNNIEMDYEPLDYSQTLYYLKKSLQQQLLKHKVELKDEDIDSLLKLKVQNEKLYFYKIFEIYSKIADLNKKKYCGFKIFFNHFNFKEEKVEIKNPLSLLDIVNHVDKIIVLSRDTKEVVFSLAQAIKTNGWHTKFRDKKLKNIALNDKEIRTTNLLLSGTFNFFNQIKELPKEQPNKFLFLNYDDFSTNAYDKIEDFLEIKINKNLNPFKKNLYNYDDFFERYPTLKETAEKYNTVF